MTSTISRFAAGCATLLTLACAGIREPPRVTPPCDGRPCLQIGSFNAYWLGADRRHEQPMRTPREVRRMAAWLADDLDLEVVVLQEVNTEVDALEDGKPLFARDRYRWLADDLERRGYRLMAGASGKAQRVVIAYDADEVELLAPARELEVRDSFDFDADCRRDGLRRPLAAHLRAGSFDFWVVGLHLKSKRGGECSDRIRDGQASDLATAVDALVSSSGEDDVILIGDFNALGDEPSIAALRSPGGFAPLTPPALRVPGSGEISYLIPPYASLIDHLMIRRDATTEWIEGSTVVFDPGRGRPLKRYVRKLSDHAPVWASFATDRDDD